MNMEVIKKMLVELEEEYDNLIDEMERFIENPTRKSKRDILLINKDFNWTKVKLIRRISDYWCKGE